MAKRGSRGARFLAAALSVLLLVSLLSAGASAANKSGLSVEKLSFRDVLRLYTADRAHFGTDALATDENGVTNAAKNLAEMFAYTVGLNYTGQGYNYNYFGKDVSKKMGSEPYTEANLLATYSVEILPVRSRAEALPEGKTTHIRVYLTGYKNAAIGVEPVLHYVWQENGSWLAVKDDNPYYRVSYNGQSAADCPYTIVQSHSQNGTGSLGAWRDLADAEDGTVVQLSGSTLVAGTGGASVFAVTGDWDSLRQNGGMDSLMAVSDFVQGDTSYQTGPLVYNRECRESGSARSLAEGEELRQGVTYRFRVTYDEALIQNGGTPGALIRSQANGRESAGEDFVWYGASEYLTSDKYDPHTVEFSFTPNGEGKGVCSVSLRNMTGSDSRLRAAEFHLWVDALSAPVSLSSETAETPASPAATAATDAPAANAPASAENSAPAAAAAPTATPAPAATATPEPTAEIPAAAWIPGFSPAFAAATATPEATPAPAPEATATPKPTAAPTLAPTLAPTPAPTAAPTPAPASTPSAMTQATTLPLLTAGGGSALVTKGALAESLWILSGRQVTGLPGSFTDMTGRYDMDQAVIWADATGLIAGNGDGSFGVNSPVSREEAAAILYRYAVLKGLSTGGSADLSPWTDGALVSKEARAAVRWALENDLLPLRNGGMIAPSAPAVCSEVTGMIYRLQKM